MHNPQNIKIYQNWDGTCSLSLDGQVILKRRSRKECEEKATFITTSLLINSLQTKGKTETQPEPEKVVDTPPATP